MIELRVLGIVVALLALAFTTYRASRGRMRRLDLIIAWAVALALVTLGVYRTCSPPPSTR